MDKITIETIKKHIEAKDIKLFPTQQALCVPIINRIYQKMKNDLKFDDIKVCNELIVDGHHRYISALLAGKEIGRVPANKTSATKKYEWTAIEFVEDEWDTKEKIEKLNKDDAEFNNIPLTKIKEMTK